jgi:SNF2 family DNA or RNA helicase
VGLTITHAYLKDTLYACLTCRRQHTVLLTGTPMQNNLHELYALLSYLHADIFTDSAPFDDAFDLAHHKVSQQMQQRSIQSRFCRRQTLH